MKGFAAVLRLELHEKRMVLPVGLFFAAAPWLVPLIPGATRPGAELRAAASLLIGLGFAFGGAALFGASLFGPDLSSGRLSFPLSRPITSAALLWGRLAAAAALLGGLGFLVLLPAALSSEGVAPFVRDIPLWLVAPTSLLVLLAANAGSIALRSRSRWLAVDAVLVPVSAVVVWLGVRCLRLAGAHTFLVVAISALSVVLLVALVLAALAQIELGRTDRLRAHGALSLTLWGITLPAVAAFGAVSLWAATPSPSALRSRWVREAAPTGGWVALSGTARNRFGMWTSFLFDAESGRFLRLEPNANTAFSPDGRWALVQRAQVGTAREPLPLEVADLGAAKPALRELGASVPADSWASLALSDDGRRAAVLGDGLLQLVDVGTGRVVAAVKTAASERETRLRFLSLDRVLLFPGFYPRRTPREERPAAPAAAMTLPLAIFDTTRGLERTGSVEATTPSSFQLSRDGTRLLQSEPSVPRVTVRDARTGVPRCAFEGFARASFLDDGRAAMVSGRGLAPKLGVVGVDCRLEKEVPMPEARFLAPAGEPARGVMSVAVFRGPAGKPASAMLLVDLATGTTKEVPGLAPARTAWINTPIPPAIGSVGARLCTDRSGALVLLDGAAGSAKGVLPAPGS